MVITISNQKGFTRWEPFCAHKSHQQAWRGCMCSTINSPLATLCFLLCRLFVNASGPRNSGVEPLYSIIKVLLHLTIKRTWNIDSSSAQSFPCDFCVSDFHNDSKCITFGHLRARTLQQPPCTYIRVFIFWTYLLYETNPCQPCVSLALYVLPIVFRFPWFYFTFTRHEMKIHPALVLLEEIPNSRIIQ